MTKTARTATHVIDAHRNAGRTFTAGGIQSFVRTEGDGEPVVCIHGMLGSSFGYRKVLRELAARGLRGIAWDLPGFGLAARPAAHDYSWTSLGRFCIDAVNALHLDRFHLVVHDIGGPVGFELAAAVPERIASLTILNTVVDVVGWTPPWTMRPFRWPVAGELWAAGMAPPAFRFLMKLQGVGDLSQLSKADLDAYLALMKGNDRGRAFLKVSRSAETTPEKQALYRQVVGSRSYPVQVVWAVQDPAMPVGSYGEKARAAAGLPAIDRIPGKHFPQEDQAAAIAGHVAAIASQPAPEDANRQPWRGVPATQRPRKR
ncbi:MAG: alpha/beta fold hydrolase [Streptosporangiaceae bacterium]